MPVDFVAHANALPSPDPVGAPCTSHLEVYLDPRLEGPPPTRSSASAQSWNSYQGLVQQARSICAGCPLLTECLYEAVVHSDIAGYVACTTPPERQAIRRHLGVTLQTEDMDAVAGARTARGPVEHAEVLRVRAAYPDDSLGMLARRLGCSLSTVKRHMRRARAEVPSQRTEPGVPEQRPAPTMESVFDAFELVVEDRHLRSA